nr:hematopoietic prostaglandin D synthase-like [Cherax quadricarinatus]
MPEYKLIYFDAMGRAELTRWIFKLADIPYTDERIPAEEWPERKKSTPGGTLPVLLVDEQVLRQSMAIARYVAREAGLVPQDNLESALCDALVETVMELQQQMIKIMRSPGDDEEKKTKLQQEFIPNQVEQFFTCLRERLHDREWYCGDQVSHS